MLHANEINYVRRNRITKSHEFRTSPNVLGQTGTNPEHRPLPIPGRFLAGKLKQNAISNTFVLHNFGQECIAQLCGLISILSRRVFGQNGLEVTWYSLQKNRDRESRLSVPSFTNEIFTINLVNREVEIHE